MPIMLATVVFVATGVLYAAACVLYLVLLMRGSEGSGRFANRVLMAAVVGHLGYLALDIAAQGGIPMGDIHQTLTVVSLGIVLAFLIACWRRRGIQILGAFITPLVLFFFLGSTHSRAATEMPEAVGSALLPIHIGVNVLGVVAFALAFSAAVAYVLQERMLRQKNLGGVFQRLPALDVLDTFGFRSVVVGFPLLTLGIVTGAFWAFEINPQKESLSGTQTLALVAWLFFAGVLLLRAAAGWRGRRAAIGTILGFLCAMLVLVGYFVRGAVGGIG